MRVTDEDGVRRLAFDRPDAKNAFTTETGEEMVAAIDGTDPDEHDAIVITGEGDTFSAGGDLESVSDDSESTRETYERYDRGSGFVESLLSAPVPTVARINGDAVGVGLSIVALCDFAYAVESATLSAAFVKIGLLPDGGGTVFLQRHVGLRDALDLALTGRFVSATEAADMGLLNDVVADQAALDDRVGERVGQLQALPTGAVVATRQALHENATRHWERAVDYENLLQAQATDTDEHRAAVEAFMNRG